MSKLKWCAIWQKLVREKHAVQSIIHYQRLANIHDALLVARFQRGALGIEEIIQAH